MSTKHTPLRLETSPDGTVIDIVGADDRLITSIDWGFDIADAANMGRLIVLAVNSHDDLVEALQRLVSLDVYSSVGEINAAIDQARAALSKAKGE